MSRAEELLLERGALLRGHFLLSSGRHSDTYLQCAVALQYPDTASELGSLLAAAVRETVDEEPAVVVSPALGGLVIGHEVGRALGVRACFTERVEGSMQLRRGFRLESGAPALLVEDVVTTGLSSREALAVIARHGGRPIAAACIANRSGLTGLGTLPLASALQLDAPTWSAEECPLCAAGAAPAIKPGSRAG